MNGFAVQPFIFNLKEYNLLSSFPQESWNKEFFWKAASAQKMDGWKAPCLSCASFRIALTTSLLTYFPPLRGSSVTELGEIPIKPNLTGSWAETQFISFPNPSATPTRWASASPSSVWPIAGADDSPSEHTDTEWNCKAEMTACPETCSLLLLSCGIYKNTLLGFIILLMLLGRCVKLIYLCSSVCGSGETEYHIQWQHLIFWYTFETFRVSYLRTVEFLPLSSDPWANSKAMLLSIQSIDHLHLNRECLLRKKWKQNLRPPSLYNYRNRFWRIYKKPYWFFPSLKFENYWKQGSQEEAVPSTQIRSLTWF